MIDFDFRNKCYSCGACFSVCARNAISFDENLYPSVDREKCVECHQCEKVCPVYYKTEPCGPLRGDCFAGRTRNSEILKKSSSGGIFYELASCVIEEGGFVSGCAYAGDFSAEHIVTGDTKEALRMLGSKYVKSSIGDTYIKIKELLKSGKTVLFSGTPCQTAALRKVAGDPEKLITVAVVCHGSIEPSAWSRYLKEKSNGKEISGITMRDKSHGWLNYGLVIDYADGTSFRAYRNETGYFLQAFVRGLFERERCLSCEFKGSEIKADILLGDGWGVESVLSEFNDGLGVSDIFCLTQKGRDLLNRLEERLETRPLDIDYAIDHNRRIITPAQRNADREKFLRELGGSGSMEATCKKYTQPTLAGRLIRKIKSIR